MTTITTNKKHIDHIEQKNNDLRKLTIESSIQENGTLESGLNFLIALKALPINLVIVKNIYSKTSSRVSVCGIEELKFNVMQKPRVDLIQYPLLMHGCLHKLTNSRGALSYATTYTCTKHLALEMVKGNVHNQNTKKHGH